MTTFVDTSAIYALLDGRDADHAAVSDAWRKISGAGARLVTTNYVLVETMALLQNRLGISAVEAFVSRLLPLLRVEWVDQQAHEAAAAAVLAARRRELSLVDCVSFAVMRRLGVESALTVNSHFAEQGFKCMPGPESTA